MSKAHRSTYHKKKRIIITMHYLELGGAEMALIGLLNALDPAKVDVDLMIYRHQGPLMNYIPDWINLLPESKAYSSIEAPMMEAVKKGQLGIVSRRLKAKIDHRNYIQKNEISGEDISIFSFLGKSITPYLPKINPKMEYDLCISFLLPHDFALHKINAKKKIAWLHTDYSNVHIAKEIERKIWNGFDKIVSISEEVGKGFASVYPELASRLIQMENILPEKYIKSQSTVSDISTEMTGSPNLLSIGRFTYAKNFDNVPDIARRMVEQGLKDFKWHIIGFGGNEAEIRNKIKEAGMENHVIILGKKENPYPYIEACDIYVQPSRYEGKSITVREAQVLGKPVAVTAYPTASSQIQDGIDGVIVPKDNEGCAKGLVDFIKDEELQKAVSDYCRIHDYCNESEVEKIYSLLNIPT